MSWSRTDKPSYDIIPLTFGRARIILMDSPYTYSDSW